MLYLSLFVKLFIRFDLDKQNNHDYPPQLWTKIVIKHQGVYRGVFHPLSRKICLKFVDRLRQLSYDIIRIPPHTLVKI